MPARLVLPCRRQLPDILPRGYFRRLDRPLDAGVLWRVHVLRRRRDCCDLVHTNDHGHGVSTPLTKLDSVIDAIENNDDEWIEHALERSDGLVEQLSSIDVYSVRLLLSKFHLKPSRFSEHVCYSHHLPGCIVGLFADSNINPDSELDRKSG